MMLQEWSITTDIDASRLKQNSEKHWIESLRQAIVYSDIDTIRLIHSLIIMTLEWSLKGATSQVAGSPAVLDRTVIVLDRTVIVLDRTIIVLDRTVIVLDRTIIVLDLSVIAIYGIFSLNFLRLGGGSDLLWLLRAVRHTSAPALPTHSILSGDRSANKTLPRAGLFPGARSCAFKQQSV